jgi:hypothetical protein
VVDSTPGWFTLSVGGKETPAMPHDVSESAMRMLLEEMHDFERTVEVHRDSAANKYSWSITFTSHLEEWSKNPLQVANKHGDMDFTVESPAHAGVYPVNYVLYYKGTYSMAVTAGSKHIIGSPFTVEVDDGVVEAKTSTAAGDGLVGGVVGDPFIFTVQAKDVRAIEEQTIKPAATTVQHVAAEVIVDMKTETSTSLTFRGTSTTIAETDTYDEVKTKLEALFTIDTVEVDNDAENANQADAISTSSGKFMVKFTGTQVSGPVPDFSGTTGATTVTSKVAGTVPVRKEIQTFKCPPTGAVTGSFQVSFRGSTITVPAGTTLDGFQTLLSGVTAVTITGMDTSGATAAGTAVICSNGAPNVRVFVQFDEETGVCRISSSTTLA